MAMKDKTDIEEQDGFSVAGLSAWLKWIWLLTGSLMALVGGTIKLRAVLANPDLFEHVFFAGASYILLISGLVIIIVSIGYDLIFCPEDTKG